MNKMGRPAELTVVVLGEGMLPSVGEIIPCEPSLSSCCREKLQMEMPTTECLSMEIRLQAYGWCDAATSNLIVGIVESPKGGMGFCTAASRMALDEVWE